MKNLLRTLVFDDQVSLTVADTTQIVAQAIQFHNLSSSSAIVLGKALSAMTFASACLKETTGEISLSVQSDGEGGDIGVSGNGKLFMRGYIANPNVNKAVDETAVLGKKGAFTIIRDDKYARPFVGSCALPQNGGVDEAFTEYFRISEQLPTYIKTAVELDGRGELIFAGVVALQPLPFADETALKNTRETPLLTVLDEIKRLGVIKCVKNRLEGKQTVWEEREAVYKCNCSREYLTRVLVTLGKEQFHKIIKEDGEINVHCHYCNKDYVFTNEDEDKIFK